MCPIAIPRCIRSAQFFLPIIALLRNADLGALSYKQKRW